jgi:hypothetical protein
MIPDRLYFENSITKKNKRKDEKKNKMKKIKK